MTRVACVLTTKCESCLYGSHHRNPPRWHSWAGPEDIEHARVTEQADPSVIQCACRCAFEVTVTRPGYGICPWCGEEHRLRKDGTCWAHTPRLKESS